ncbi:MAG: hypothetical protein KKF89_02285 [Nanoarchaeota archaeon]|nr:hypothetical protein [Nanoarchaeota archaeon]MBU1854523.1 hypothetical protein [Nanoarchaeota archaeon]
MPSEPVFIPDNFGYSTEQFILPDNVDKKDISSIIIPGGMIRDRIKTLAREIRDDYKHDDLYMLCVLKGSDQIFSDLKHYLISFAQVGDKPFGFDYIPASSYKNDKATGKLHIGTLKYPEVIKDKRVLLIEDIIDSGKTMAGKDYVKGQIPTGGLIGHLLQYQPLEIAVASLTVKRTSESNGFKPKFAGFSIPNKFVVGYGLDFNENFRTLVHLCELSDFAKEKYEEK